MTTFGNTLDNLRGNLQIECSDSKIIKKTQRSSPADDDIVDTHGHKINADRVVLVTEMGDRQFGADAISRGDQDGFLVFV